MPQQGKTCQRISTAYELVSGNASDAVRIFEQLMYLTIHIVNRSLLNIAYTRRQLMPSNDWKSCMQVRTPTRTIDCDQTCRAFRTNHPSASVRQNTSSTLSARLADERCKLLFLSQIFYLAHKLH